MSICDNRKFLRVCRIKALFKKDFISIFRGFDALTDFLYWPLYDILLWGFTSQWIQETVDNPTTGVAIVGALILWQASYRGNLEISYTLLNELWSRNMVNLFATPIKLTDWIIAIMLASVCSASVAVLFSSLAVFLLYGINIWKVGLIIVPIIFSLLISGWVIGFFTAAGLVYWGQRVQRLVWVMSWFFVPFCGAFYPIDVLPKVVQKISYSIPMTYAFEGFRLYVTNGESPLRYIYISYLLNALYLSLALLIFYKAYCKSKDLGLSRLENE